MHLCHIYFSILMIVSNQTFSFLRDERHKQAGEVPAERSGVPGAQEAQISGKIGKKVKVK